MLSLRGLLLCRLTSLTDFSHFLIGHDHASRRAEHVADLADLYGDDGQLLPVKEWPLIWRQGLVQGIEAEELTHEGVTMGIVRKVKLSDRVKRIELIGRHVNVQAFKEQLEVTVTDRAAMLQRARQRKATDADAS